MNNRYDNWNSFSFIFRKELEILSEAVNKVIQSFREKSQKDQMRTFQEIDSFLVCFLTLVYAPQTRNEPAQILYLKSTIKFLQMRLNDLERKQDVEKMTKDIIAQTFKDGFIK